MSLDALRYEAEAVLASDGWTDRAAALVWTLRGEHLGIAAIRAETTAARDVVEDGRRSRLLGFLGVAAVSPVTVIDPWGDG